MGNELHLNYIFLPVVRSRNWSLSIWPRKRGCARFFDLRAVRGKTKGWAPALEPAGNVVRNRPVVAPVSSPRSTVETGATPLRPAARPMVCPRPFLSLRTRYSASARFQRDRTRSLGARGVSADGTAFASKSARTSSSAPFLFPSIRFDRNAIYSALGYIYLRLIFTRNSRLLSFHIHIHIYFFHIHTSHVQSPSLLILSYKLYLRNDPTHTFLLLLRAVQSETKEYITLISTNRYSLSII